MAEYRTLEWSQIEEDEWSAYGTVFSASEDWDPFEFTVRKWRGLFRIDDSSSELIPDEAAATFVCGTLEVAQAACEAWNRKAFDSEFGEATD
jgi:hypothetical protein